MAYNGPRVSVIQNFEDENITTEDAELPTCVVGILFDVVDWEKAESTFDPLTSTDQTFSWPSLKAGAVVDLDGTNNGLIDSQRKRLADFVPEFRFKDGTETHEIDDSDIKSLDQSDFDIIQEARDSLQRLTISDLYGITFDQEEVFFSVSDSFSDVESGDRFDFGGSNFTVDTRNNRFIRTEEAISSPSTSTRVESADSGLQVDVSPASDPGRITVTLSNSDWSTEASNLDEDEPMVVYEDMTGLTEIGGQINDSDSSYDEIDGLVDDTSGSTSNTFGIDISTAEVEDHVVKVHNTTEGTIYFASLESIDTDAGTLTVDQAVGSADGDEVHITIYKGQVGYVESFDTDDDTATVVVPNPFSTTGALVDAYTSAEADVKVYPVFDVEARYRAYREDLVGEIFEAGTQSEIESATDQSGFHWADNLQFATRLVQNAQPENRNVFFVPVDPEPNGSTGLPTNYDLTTGYNDALEVAGTHKDPYNIVRLQPFGDLQGHVNTYSAPEEGKQRRGFLVEPLPKGEESSATGEILPGRTSDGLAPNGDEGNTYIYDSNIDFVDGANISEGDEVVVTFPEKFEGTYTATSSTTDSVLDLDLDGDVWDITKEFQPSNSMDVTTNADGNHELRGAQTDQFAHVEENDFVEFTTGGTTYRMKIINVLADGTGFDAEDEVAGSLDLGSNSSVSDVSIIRSWGPKEPDIEYYIRPLTKSEQVSQVKSNKTVYDRRFTVTLDHDPTVEIGTDSGGNVVTREMDPQWTLLAIAAKRSGQRSNDPATNLELGASIQSVKYATYFKRSQLDDLGGEGFCLIQQDTSSSPPYIRDMITSDNTSDAKREELVTSNADWQAKSLQETFSLPPGKAPKLVSPKLVGLRTAQTDTILRNWTEPDPTRRLNGYNLKSVKQSEDKATKMEIAYDGVFPVAEKEIEFTVTVQV